MNRTQRRRLKRAARTIGDTLGLGVEYDRCVEGDGSDRDEVLRLIDAGGCFYCNATMALTNTPDGVIVNVGHADSCPRLDAIRRRQ